jgi:hypothetical protein
MRAARSLLLLLSVSAAGALQAQQLDLFDPDDFVEPRLTRGRIVFMSRLVTGVSRGYLDQYRPLGQDLGFLHIANSLYWSGLQIDYKRTEQRGEHGVAEEFRPDLGRIASQREGEVGTRSDPRPVPGPKNVTQVSWYQTTGDRLSFRGRLVYATQFAERETAAFVTGLEDRDETRVLQLDAGRRFRTRTQFVTLTWTSLTRRSTLEKTKQRTLMAGALLPVLRLGPGTLTPRIQLGGVMNEGHAIDIVNPSFDLSMRLPRAGVNLHLVYSPVYRDLGTDGDLHHQVVLYADYALLVLPLGRR